MNNRGNVLVNANLLMLGFISICCVMFNCTHDLPPMNEYQIIGFAPVGAAYQGEISVYHDTLVVLYWERNFYPCHVRKYYIGDPKEPVIADVGELDIWFIGYVQTVKKDSLLFILEAYRHSSMQIINFSNLSAIEANVDYDIYGLACNDNMLFLTADSGLRIWDISNLNNIVELYSEGDTNYRHNGRLALTDTIVFEWFYDGVNNRFRFWNVHNPQNPIAVAEGHTGYHFDCLDITNQYIITETGGVLYRFTYDFSDSLTFEDSLHFEPGVRDLTVEDSLVCLNCYDFLCILEIDNFDENWRLYQLYADYYYHSRFLSYEIYRNKIYAFIREEGIYVYERGGQ